MLLSKIKKHLFLTYVRLSQKNTIKKIYKTNDQLLRLILESFQKLNVKISLKRKLMHLINVNLTDQNY